MKTGKKQIANLIITYNILQYCSKKLPFAKWKRAAQTEFFSYFLIYSSFLGCLLKYTFNGNREKGV